ncbi:MAG: squalene--hopene cyclase [Bacteroidales bacterium]|nr:MAG: squalene--hopene cyclase [Bacteroidales bacterium]
MEKLQLENQYKTLCNKLIAEQNSNGCWTGKLSSSALAVAVSIVAIKLKGLPQNEERVNKGLRWLFNNVNADGGYGDTPESESNVSTSFLCYAAITFCQTHELDGSRILKGIENYLESQNISLKSGNISNSVLVHYGKDYTFSVPILSMLTICRMLGDEDIRKIPQLPFELTLLPASLYRFFNMQVVSYAIPALVAVGIYIFKKKNRANFLVKVIRKKSIKPAISKLNGLVPESGGFLEAIPLTAFVSMCLISCGYTDNSIVDKGIGFLNNQQREDGSWPIDTDLSTWVTTLSIKALGDNLFTTINPESVEQMKNHLLSLQYKEKHPFNGAEHGGWGWTSFSGSVPDADDTSGAILALSEMYQGNDDETKAIIDGCNWLTNLQNSDGGIPTFCKGWGRLPFDQSCADLTGHTLLAITCSLDILGDKITAPQKAKFKKCINKASIYLQKNQHRLGSWMPLWFGNQNTSDKKNPVYGTAKVATYIQDCLKYKWIDYKLRVELQLMLTSAQNYLMQQQNDDGSWGGYRDLTGSIEETSLAICALTKKDREVCMKGFKWLEKEYNTKGLRSKPIGLYFATLWYDEKLYPLTFYIEALRRAQKPL